MNFIISSFTFKLRVPLIAIRPLPSLMSRNPSELPCVGLEGRHDSALRGVCGEPGLRVCPLSSIYWLVN